MNTHLIPKFTFPQELSSELSLSLEKLDAKASYNSHAPHRHDYYEIFFFRMGGGLHMIDFEEFRFTKGHIHLLYPGQVHYIQREAGSSGWVLKFSSSLFLTTHGGNLFHMPFLQFGNTASIIQSGEQEFFDLLGLLDEIRQEEKNKNMGYQEVMLSILNLILWKCYRLTKPNTQKYALIERNVWMKFLVLLEDNYATQNRVTFYAEQLDISPDKLNLAVKTASGSCPSRLIAARILLEAKRWLLHSKMSIKEIAYELNFQDHAYFNRWFKKQVACSPGEFRRRTKEKYHA